MIFFDFVVLRNLILTSNKFISIPLVNRITAFGGGENMPMYRYRCPNCENEIILLRSMSDRSPVFCRECGAEMQKVISNVGIIFKGSGFYSTDSKNSGKNDTSASKSSKANTSKSPSHPVNSSTSHSKP